MGAAALLVVAAALAVCAPAYARTYSPEYEAKVGDEAAAQIDKEYKAWTGPEAEEKLKSVQAMVDGIRAATSRPEVKYVVKLVDAPEENAFTIPGGRIYVTKPLLTSVQSDAELAGVLAHEMAHNVTYDALRQIDRDQRLTIGTLAAVLASALVGARGEKIFGVLQAGGLVTGGMMSQYSIEIERDADLHAVQFLLKTSYGPVGLLTFMERLAARERASVQFEMGIAQSHPGSIERAAYLRQALDDAGVAINRRAVTKWSPPTVEKVTIGEGEQAREGRSLKLWGVEVLRYEAAPVGRSLDERGADMAEALRKALSEGADEWGFVAQQIGDGPEWAVLGGGVPIITVSSADAAVFGKGVPETARAAAGAIRRALRKDYLTNLYQVPPAVPKPEPKPSG